MLDETVAIRDYDARWPELFASEADHIRAALSELRELLRTPIIEHIGSTAVPGLAAKPVIDIQISVAREADIEPCRQRLLASDYSATHVPISYLHKPATWPHTHHVHIRVAGSHEGTRLCSFRDWLRSHPEDRAAYAALKRGLARQVDLTQLAGRARYSEAKSAFVRAVEARAGLGFTP